MSKWDKLLSKILNLANDIRFEEIRKILESYGYEMKQASGGTSHYVFRKEGRNPVTIPKHEPIKKAYVAIVKDIIESEEKHNEDD